MRCQKDGKRGFKWGRSGKCFTGAGAKEKAQRQGKLIESGTGSKRKRRK